MKYCKDCIHFRNADWSPIYCDRVSKVEKHPIWGEQVVRNNNGVIAERASKHKDHCGINARFYEKLWWKFWIKD